MMDFMGSDGPVMECLHRACETGGFPLFVRDSWERGVVRRGESWEHPLSKSRERQIAKARRAIACQTGTDAKLVDRSLDPAVVEEFLVMELAGWKGREGGSAFAKDDHKSAWFREWYQRWAPTGRLIVLCIEVGDVPVAFQFCVRAGQGIFLFREAYDESYARYGPGAMVVADSMEFLFKNSDAQWLDSSTDKDNTFLLELLPERRVMSTLYVGVGGKLDRSMMAVLPAMTKLLASQRDMRDERTRARSEEPATALN